METPKLSPAKINSTKLLPGTSISTKKISTKSLQSDSNSILKNDLVIIKKQVFKIRDLIQTSTLIRQSELEKKRKSDERKKTEEKENKLEAKPEKKEEKLKMPSVPKLGFLDRIKNFVFNVLLGYFTIKLLPHLPKLVSVVSIIGNVMEFMIDLGGNILDKVVTFIDWGYKAIDATRGFLKSFGGDFTLKMFDNFTGAIEGVITATIAASIALTSLGDDDSKGPGGGTLRVGGKGAGRVDPRVARRYAERFGRDAALQKFGKKGLEKLGGKYARSTATNLARKGLVDLAGKGGTKMILGFVRPLLKRLPIIGALIDFGLSVALGEDPGRAAFKSIGAGLLGSVGTVLAGGATFGLGAIVGGLAGGLAGDAIGGALYDLFFGGKKPQQKNQKVEKKAGGGITRGGKIQGTVKRTIKKPKRTIKTLPSKVKPGQSVGGEKKIKNIFPEVETKDKSKKINPYGYMKSSYDKLSSTQAFGGLFALPLKAQLGEKPSSADYKVAAEGLNSWMQRTFSSEIMRTGGVGFAEGGKVEAGMFTLGEDMTKVIEKSLEESISSKVTAAINDLKRQLGLKPDEGKKGEKDKKEGEGKDDPSLNVGDGAGGMTEGTWGPLLDLIAGKESGGNYEAMYPGTTLPGATKMTIADVARRATGAVGKYQQLPQFLVDRAKTAGLNPDKDLYSPENQEKIIINVNIKGRGGERWLKNEISDEQFMQGLSQEFASLPNAQGRFYYPGQSSAMTAEKVKAALSKVKRGRMSGRGAVDEPSSELPSGVRGGSMRTGPREYIGRSSAYHIDTKFHRSLGMSNMVSAMDKLANAYSARGRKIEFSNAGVAGAVWSPKASDADKKSLLQRAIDAHSHSTFMRAEGFLPFDYYNPKKNETRFGKSVEGSEILLPTFGGKVVIGTKYSGYGKSAEIFKGDKMVAMTGHGDTRYEKGGRVNKPTFALLGEKGPEFVFDADTTAGLNELAPGLLDQLNIAKTKPQLASILQSYAEYEDGGEQIVIISREMIPIPMLMQNPNLSGGMIPMSSSVNTTYDRQFANA